MSAEALICDFGGVLTTPLLEAFAGLQARRGLPLDALGRAMATVAAEHGENPLYDLERGRMSEAEFLRRLGAAMSADLGREVALHDFGEAYFAELRPNEAMIHHLREVRARGVRLALCTNNVREWEARWRAMLPVDELFEVVVDSAFVGLRKPDPAIYELTLTRLDLPGAACVFVDDLDHNCQAAEEAGMRAVRFRSTEQAIADIDAALAA